MKENSSTQPNTAASGQEPNFYVVSKKKFFILFIGTTGIYAVYWFYKNWKLYKDATSSQLWPIPRAIFTIFFIHNLFGLVKEKITNKNGSWQWNHRSNATALVVLIIISNLLDRLAMDSIGSPYVDLLSLGILLPLAFSLYEAQAAINYSCDDPEGVTNKKITGANYFWLAIGACLWMVSIQSILLGIMGLMTSDSGF
jgi:hypothetical protein